MGACSTGQYLKPAAPGGTYNTENPACPGAEEVIEFNPTGDNWIIFRVLSKLPNKFNPEGTRLIAYFRFVYHMPEEPQSTWTSLFPSEEEREEQRQLVEHRQQMPLLISAESSDATIVLPDGSTKTVSLPFFEEPYDPNKVESPYNIWGPEVLISPHRLENFKVVFPAIFFNGEKLDIPPVSFGISGGTYAPVLNC